MSGLVTTGTVNIVGTGGIIEGNLGTSNVDVNLDPALHLDGSADYLTASSANFRSSDSVGAVTAWVKSDDYTGAADQQFFSSTDSATGDYYMHFYIGGGDGKLYVKCKDSSAVYELKSTNAIVGDGTWHHVAVVSNGSAISMYIDGVAETVVVAGGSNNGDWFGDMTGGKLDDVSIGCKIDNGGAGSFFDGCIADVRYYSDAITATEVATLASKINAETSTIDNLQHWWKLNSTTIDASNLGEDYGSATDIDLTPTSIVAGNFDYDAYYVNVHDNSTTTDGTFTVTQGKVEGKALTSLAFDGGTSHVDLASSFTMSHDGSTVAFWVKKDNATGNIDTILGQASDANQHWIQIKTNGEVVMRDYPNDLGTTSQIADTNWNHVIITMNGDSNGAIYFNGVSQPIDDNDIVGNPVFDVMGIRSTVDELDAKLRDVKVFDYALSAEQAASLYSGTYPQTPKHWWKIDEGTGTAVEDYGTGTDADGTIDGATYSNGTLDLDGTLTIAANGTLSAPRGTLTSAGGFDATGTFTHNSGTVEFDNSAEKTLSGTDGTVYHNLLANNSDTRTVSSGYDFTVENSIVTNSSKNFKIRNTVITLGTTTSAGTITNNGVFAPRSGGQTMTLQGASSLFPFTATGNAIAFDGGGSGHNWSLANADIQTAVTTGGSSLTMTLIGDCEFDAFTVSSGDTLDLNGQRAEFSGLLSSTGTIACGTNALVVADSVNTSSTTSGNMNLIETGDGHTHTLTSSTITNWMLNGGTISNSAHGHAADNIIIGTGKLDQGNNLASGTPIVNVTTATGADLDSNTHTLTLSGDLTMSGGLIGKSAVLFDGTNDVGSAPSATASTTNPTDNLFVEAWWKSTNTTPETTSVIGKEDSYLLYINSSGYFQGYVYGSSSDISVSGGWMGSIFDQKWHHIAMGYSQAGGLKIWLDGRLVGYNATNAGTLNQNANGLRIMRYGSNYGQGTVAMGRIWTGAVPTDAQLRSNMFKGEADSPAYTSGVIQTAWYFDEGTGTTVEDVGVGTDADLLLEGSPAWAAGGTYDKTNGPAIVMAGTTQDITCKNGLDIYDLTINDGSTTSIHTIDNSAGRLDVYGNLTVNEKLTSSASSNTSGITMKTAAKTLTVASDVKTTALATLYQVVLDHGGTTEIDEMNLKLVEVQSGATLKATGDFTVTTELEVGNTCTLNANGKTLTCKLLDMNGTSTLDLASSTLILSSTDGLTSHPNVTLNGGPGATVSGSSAATTFESQNNFVIVGNIENLNVTNEELSILGNVTNCTGDIHRWNPTIDTGQLLDADTADDRDVRLGSDLDRNTELVT